MGGRPPGARRRRRREARVERPSARRDTRAVKGGSGSRTATPTGLNWDFGGRRGRVWRGCAGAARERLSSPSVTSEDALPLVLPYPPDPSPGAWRQARRGPCGFLSPGEGGQLVDPATLGPPSWPPPHTSQIEGQLLFQKRSNSRADHPPTGAGWGAADAAFHVGPSPIFHFQGTPGSRPAQRLLRKQTRVPRNS